MCNLVKRGHRAAHLEAHSTFQTNITRIATFHRLAVERTCIKYWLSSRVSEVVAPLNEEWTGAANSGSSFVVHCRSANIRSGSPLLHIPGAAAAAISATVSHPSAASASAVVHGRRLPSSPCETTFRRCRSANSAELRGRPRGWNGAHIRDAAPVAAKLITLGRD